MLLSHLTCRACTFFGRFDVVHNINTHITVLQNLCDTIHFSPPMLLPRGRSVMLDHIWWKILITSRCPPSRPHLLFWRRQHNDATGVLRYFLSRLWIRRRMWVLAVISGRRYLARAVAHPSTLTVKILPPRKPFTRALLLRILYTFSIRFKCLWSLETKTLLKATYYTLTKRSFPRHFGTGFRKRKRFFGQEFLAMNPCCVAEIAQ